MKTFYLYKHLLVTLLLLGLSLVPASASENHTKEKIDVKEIVLGHMSDAYSWHIINFNGSTIQYPCPSSYEAKIPANGMYSAAHVLKKQAKKGKPTAASFSTKQKTARFTKNSQTAVLSALMISV